jgi:hypothetical protein
MYAGKSVADWPLHTDDVQEGPNQEGIGPSMKVRAHCSVLVILGEAQ